ncbi:hypothetical protein VOF76_27840, partial [Leclercia adecarboxylata]
WAYTLWFMACVMLNFSLSSASLKVILKNHYDAATCAKTLAFMLTQVDIIHTINKLRIMVMRNLILGWFIFINIYGSVALVKEISTNYMNGSHLPWLLAIPILVVTNFMAGRVMTKPARKQ